MSSFARLLQQFLSQHTNVRQVAITFPKIEPVTHDKFVFDFESNIICVDTSSALFLLAQQHTHPHAARLGRFQLLTNCCQCVTAIQNIVHDQNISVGHIRKRKLFENYFAARLRFSMVTRGAEKLQFERQWNLPKGSAMNIKLPLKTAITVNSLLR